MPGRQARSGAIPPALPPTAAATAGWAHIAALPSARDPKAFLFACYAEGRGQSSLIVCWRAVCAAAKLGRLRLHDLRHTMASQIVMVGENVPQVGKLLGHRRHHRTTAGGMVGTAACDCTAVIGQKIISIAKPSVSRGGAAGRVP